MSSSPDTNPPSGNLGIFPLTDSQVDAMKANIDAMLTLASLEHMSASDKSLALKLLKTNADMLWNVTRTPLVRAQNSGLAVKEINGEGMAGGEGKEVLEIRKIMAETERASAQAQRSVAETGRLVAETEREKADVGKLVAEKEKVKEESEKIKAEINRFIAEKEKIWAETENSKVVSEKIRAEIDRFTAEKEKLWAEAEKLKRELERIRQR